MLFSSPNEGNSKSLSNSKSPRNIRLLLIGDKGVGKTTILVRYSEGTFLEYPSPTCGVDIFSVSYQDSLKAKSNLQIYDSSGSVRFRSILSPFYRAVDGIVLVYSVDSYDSLQGVKEWLRLISQHVNTHENIQMILVGNKLDLEYRRQVEKEEGEHLAKQLKCPFFETSAKENSNIKEAFDCISDKVLETIDQSFYFVKDTSVWNVRKNVVTENVDGFWLFSSIKKSVVSCFGC